MRWSRAANGLPVKKRAAASKIGIVERAKILAQAARSSRALPRRDGDPLRGYGKALHRAKYSYVARIPSTSGVDGDHSELRARARRIELRVARVAGTRGGALDRRLEAADLDELAVDLVHARLTPVPMT